MTISFCPHVSVATSQVEIVRFVSTETVLVRRKGAYCTVLSLETSYGNEVIVLMRKLLLCSSRSKSGSYGEKKSLC